MADKINDDKISESQIKKGAKTFVNLCAHCKHSEFLHTKLKVRDQSRSSYSGSYLSECRQCKEEGKICETFKEKKTSLIDKIKNLFK